MKYFPLASDTFAHRLGVKAMGSDERLIETTEHYPQQIELKRNLLLQCPSDYVSLLSEQADVEHELVEHLRLQSEHLCNGQNQLLHEPYDFSANRLFQLARHLQEDLVLLANDPARDYPIMGGVVCFPSGWSLPEKLGKGIAHVHEPVPEFESVLATQTRRMLDSLKVDRPIWRMNWGVRPSAQLDQSPKHTMYLQEQQSLITAENAGDRCFLRVEKQTLSRMPKSGHILFTIHTHQSCLADLSTDQQRLLFGTLQTCPADTLAYKGLAKLAGPVMEYLHRSVTG
jgi:hypothetical protein